jgi:hypothetical protein
VGLLDVPSLSIAPRAHVFLARTFDIVGPGGAAVGSIEGGSTSLELRDDSGAPVATFGRPWVVMRTSISVTLADGRAVGTVQQITPFGRIRFDLLDPSGGAMGSLEPAGYGAQNFAINDASGTTLGRLTRAWRFFMRTGDYALEFSSSASADIRILAIAAVVAIDKAVRRRRRGGGGGGVAGGGGAA